MLKCLSNKRRTYLLSARFSSVSSPPPVCLSGTKFTVRLISELQTGEVCEVPGLLTAAAASAHSRGIITWVEGKHAAQPSAVSSRASETTHSEAVFLGVGFWHFHFTVNFFSINQTQTQLIHENKRSRHCWMETWDRQGAAGGQRSTLCVMT